MKRIALQATCLELLIHAQWFLDAFVLCLNDVCTSSGAQFLRTRATKRKKDTFMQGICKIDSGFLNLYIRGAPHIP